MVVASRYAKSLLDLAIETKQLEEVRKDMLIVKDVCSQSRDFVSLLESPVIKTDKKLAVFKEIFGGKISKTTSAFLELIAKKRRESYVRAIASEFDEQYKHYKNITTVKVQSAVALDGKLRKQILDVVQSGVKGEVELIEKVDPALIGGFVLTIADKQLDQSVKRKLNDLKKTLGGKMGLPSIN